MPPKLLQVNLVFLCCVGDSCQARRCLRSTPAVRLWGSRHFAAGSRVLPTLCCLSRIRFLRTIKPRRVGKMLFLLENVHCATAGDTEQNGFKRFTVARRAFITCFRRVMIIFAGSFQGNVKIVTCFVRQTKPFSLFCGAQSTLRFRFFPCKCQPNQS